MIDALFIVNFEGKILILFEIMVSSSGKSATLKMGSEAEILTRAINECGSEVMALCISQVSINRISMDYYGYRRKDINFDRT